MTASTSSISTQFRSLFVEYSNLGQVDASAVFSQGRTVIQAALIGPEATPSHRQDCERASFSCIFRRAHGTSKDDPSIRKIEYFVGQTLQSALLSHLYPRTQIQIILQELQGDGPLLAPAINAGMAAMLESGLSMACMLAGICVAVVPKPHATNDGVEEQELLLDPTAFQAQQSSSCITLVFARQSNQVTLVSLHHENRFSIFLMPKIVRLARAAADQMFEFYEQSIRKRFLGDQSTVMEE